MAAAGGDGAASGGGVGRGGVAGGGARGDARRPSEVEGGGWRPQESAADYTWACVGCCRWVRAWHRRGRTRWAVSYTGVCALLLLQLLRRSRTSAGGAAPCTSGCRTAQHSPGSSTLASTRQHRDVTSELTRYINNELILYIIIHLVYFLHRVYSIA